MSEDRSIATQTQLESVNLGLSTLSDNLAAHANADLSDAHGLNLIFGPVNDGHGNNLSVYADSHNDVVGGFQISLTINGNRVFMPAQMTALAGKPPTAGIDVSSILSETGVGESAWVTNFDDTFTAVILAILETYLLPHTLTGYWEAHGGTPLVSPELQHFGPPGSGSAAGWWDSAGHHVADSSIKMNVDGQQLRIPCSTRLGGPFQDAILGLFSPASTYRELGGDENESDLGIFSIHPVVTGGTQPFTYAYLYLGSDTLWHAIPPSTNFTVPPIYFDTGEGTSPGDHAIVNYSPTTGILTYGPFSLLQEGTNVGFIVRVTVTGPDAIVIDRTPGGQYPQFTYQLHRKDDDSSWFCGQSLATAPQTVEDRQALTEVTQYLLQTYRRGTITYLYGGQQLLKNMLKLGVPQSFFEEYTKTLIGLWRAGKKDEAAAYCKNAIISAFKKYWPNCPYHWFKKI